ncbi:Sodium/potassium/calcium exchanger 6, partial [Ophiophagus hannah]
MRQIFWLGLMQSLWVLCVAFLLDGETDAVGPSVGRWNTKFPASFSADGHGRPSGTQSSASNVDCREVGKQNQSDRCSFIRHNPNCKMDSGFLNYLNGVFCVFPAALQPLAITLYVLWLLYLFVILGVTAEKFAVVAFSDPRTAGLAIGALFGAGIFVTTIVAGGIALVRPFTAASRPFLRDAIFYMVAVFLTFVALYFEQVTLAEALSFLGLYIFYVLTVVVSTWLHKRQRRERLASSSHPEPEEEYQPLLPLEETTFRILTQSINPLDYRKNGEPPRCHFLFAFLGFFVSAMWINATATEVVNILQTLGITFHLSNTVLGLTLLAWGNSIGDMFSDLTMARQGYPRMAFSACFGGIIFSILL